MPHSLWSANDKEIAVFFLTFFPCKQTDVSDDIGFASHKEKGKRWKFRKPAVDAYPMHVASAAPGVLP